MTFDDFIPQLLLIGVYTFIRISGWMRKVERYIDENGKK
jgi:hypothetical protein